jgi:hypothetical protein
VHLAKTSSPVQSRDWAFNKLSDLALEASFTFAMRCIVQMTAPPGLLPIP